MINNNNKIMEKIILNILSLVNAHLKLILVNSQRDYLNIKKKCLLKCYLILIMRINNFKNNKNNKNSKNNKNKKNNSRKFKCLKYIICFRYRIKTI